MTVPNLDVFQRQGLVLGAKWAHWMDQNPVLGFGVESEIWFYDGGRAYLQLADAVGDSWTGLSTAPPAHSPSWYAQNILDQYENYILGQPTPPGIGPGYRIFPYGIMMQAWRTGVAKHKQALDYMIKNSAFIRADLRFLRKHNEPAGVSWGPWLLRESAYAADCLICQLAFEGVTSPLLQPAIFDCVIADLQEFMRPGSSTYLGTSGTRDPAKLTFVNNFMVGLALETLIHYHDLTGDANIPPIVQAVLDFFWINCVEKVDPFTAKPSFAQYYNSDLVNGAAKGALMPDGVTPVRWTASSLNLLVCPAYAWYWLVSGDNTYLDQGDKMWSAGVMGAGWNCSASVKAQDYTYMGKEYSQHYKWGYDYIRWRSRPESTTAKGNNLR